jgi:hypothetical protein
MEQIEKNRLLLKLDKIRGQVSDAEASISRAKQNLYKVIQDKDKEG